MDNQKPSLESTLKSADTEEFTDIHFYRPIGYRWALLFQQLGITPNVVTIASLFLGVAAGICFYFPNIWISLLGIFLLVWANTFDSADGQLARMTKQYSSLGRVLDGLAGDLWFASIYIAIGMRLDNGWGGYIWLLVFTAGYFHSKQASTADYYRNIHLLFLKGQSGSELHRSTNLTIKYKELSWKRNFFPKFVVFFYRSYTRGQESVTPNFQKMLGEIQIRYNDTVPNSFRIAFRDRSLPLMKWTNTLSFNTRAFVLFASLLVMQPWIYFVFELTFLNLLLIYMIRKHEQMCKICTAEIKEGKYDEERAKESHPIFDVQEIQGIIFDYGGTIDSNGKHWAEVLWDSYQQQQVAISKEQFREAYIYAERYLAMHPVIEPSDNFRVLLQKKVRLQIEYLIEKHLLTESSETSLFIIAISNQCYTFAQDLISAEKSVLEKLREKYPMVLVSNFYGNIHAVLADFGLLEYFDQIVESAVVGLRKPDPAIFALGVAKLNMAANQVVVIGDSYAKDIVPASLTGCKTIWLRGLGWEEDDKNATANVIITEFMQLEEIFQLA